MFCCLLALIFKRVPDELGSLVHLTPCTKAGCTRTLAYTAQGLRAYRNVRTEDLSCRALYVQPPTALLPVPSSVSSLKHYRLLYALLTGNPRGTADKTSFVSAHFALYSLQMEFYLGDSNLPKDRYLLGLVSADPEGFVDLAILCTFTRMRRLLGEALSAPPSSQHSGNSRRSSEGRSGGDASGGAAAAASAGAMQQARWVELVAGALQESEVVTLSADGKRVRRTEVRLEGCLG